MRQTDKLKYPSGIKSLLKLFSGKKPGGQKKDLPEADTAEQRQKLVDRTDDLCDCYCCVGLTSWYALPPRI